MIAQILLLACSAASASPSTPDGTLAGIVVNASRNKEPVSRCEVVLRLRREGQLVPLVETIADAQGRFLFTPLPLGKNLQYVPARIGMESIIRGCP